MAEITSGLMTEKLGLDYRHQLLKQGDRWIIINLQTGFQVYMLVSDLDEDTEYVFIKSVGSCRLEERVDILVNTLKRLQLTTLIKDQILSVLTTKNI